jgi:bifunctional non-homologous end joining protein LigD
MFINPMLLKPSAVLPVGDQWRYELKFDGFRGLAIKEGKDVRLFSRNGRSLSVRFWPIVDAIASLKVKNAIIDGEIVCLASDGRPCFEDLQNMSPVLEANLFFYAFDLLHLNGRNVFDAPIEERKERLRDLLPEGGPLRLSDFIDGDPAQLEAFTRANRLEGIVAKRRRSFYEPGKRSGVWTKFKTYQTADFLIGGYLPCPGGIEALTVGFMRNGAFQYAAHVEVYLKGKALDQLVSAVRNVRPTPCAFERVPIKKRGDTWSVGLTKEDADRAVWIKPSVPVNVRFTERTKIGLLRHAGLLG